MMRGGQEAGPHARSPAGAPGEDRALAGREAGIGPPGSARPGLANSRTLRSDPGPPLVRLI